MVLALYEGIFTISCVLSLAVERPRVVVLLLGGVQGAAGLAYPHSTYKDAHNQTGFYYPAL